jgi:hypothetical protein
MESLGQLFWGANAQSLPHFFLGCAVTAAALYLALQLADLRPILSLSPVRRKQAAVLPAILVVWLYAFLDARGAIYALGMSAFLVIIMYQAIDQQDRRRSGRQGHR